MLSKMMNIIGLSFEYYLKYFYVVIGFGLSLLALITTLALEPFDIFSGDLAYFLLPSDPNFLVVIVGILFVTIIQSFFTTMLVFMIRSDVQHRYDKTHIMDVLKDLVWQVFVYNLIINMIMLVLYVIFAMLHIAYILPLLYIVILVFTFYVNQGIVIDEQGIVKAVSLSWDFMMQEKFRTLVIIVLLSVFYIVISLLSFYIPNGYIVGIVLTHLFLIPFAEALKSVTYMTKFKIIESYLK